MIRYALALSLTLAAGPLLAQEAQPEAEPPQAIASMTPERLGEIILAIDPQARIVGSGIEFQIEGAPVMVIMDAGANRMRAMVPVVPAADLTEAQLLRIMQANFDTALDARYAVAGGQLWSVYIHPLAELRDEQFLSGLIQSVSLAATFGSTYSSGGRLFGGGDSTEILENLLNSEEI